MKLGKRWLVTALGLVVTAGFVYLAFGHLEWASVRRVLGAAAPGPLLIALAAMAGGFTLRIIRWWRMLRVLTPGLPLSTCVRPFVIGLAINNLVPLRAGDLVRSFGFRHALRSSPMQVVGTLVIERVLDMFVLLALFFLGLLGVAAGAVPSAFVATGALLGAGCLAGILVLVLIPTRLQVLISRLLGSERLRNRRWSARASALADQLLGALALLQSPARALQLLGLSVAAWMLEGAMFASVAWALGTTGSPIGPWFALATGTLATLLPSSPGYVGTFDYFAMLGLMAYGASRASAAAFALLVHVNLWLPVNLVGAFYLMGARGDAARREARRTIEAA